ncbi:MAG: hypothetical protein JNL32_08880 [Candidatus Kapabacteria bacterium]|nr:hypothetical protein [Candidatus Kapabacteria bacterium]
MTIQLEADSYSKIELLSYDRPTELTERFSFCGMTTLQATTLIEPDRKIISSKIFAYTDDKRHLDEETSSGFENIRDFNEFFLHNPDYYIHNCDLELADGLILGSHDDGEVSVQFPINTSSQKIVNSIFEKFNLDKKLIEILRNNPEHLIVIDENSNIIGDFQDFDDYIRWSRTKG